MSIHSLDNNTLIHLADFMRGEIRTLHLTTFEGRQYLTGVDYEGDAEHAPEFNIFSMIKDLDNWEEVGHQLLTERSKMLEEELKYNIDGDWENSRILNVGCYQHAIHFENVRSALFSRLDEIYHHIADLQATQHELIGAIVRCK